MTGRNWRLKEKLVFAFLLAVTAGPHGLVGSARGAPPKARPAPEAREAGHRKAHQRFKDATQWARRFEDPARDAWQKPESVVAALGLAQGDRVTDIGSATGYLTVRLARAVPRGEVWGIDIEPDMVRYLNDRARKEGLDNLQSRLGAADDPQLPEPVDLVFLCNTYHHIAQRPAYFRKVRRMLKTSGRLAVVDFLLKDIPVGPKQAHRVGPQQLTRELAAAGFRRLSLDTQTLPYQYIAIFELDPKQPRLAPPEEKTTERACRTDRQCALRPASPCSCPPCGEQWHSAINTQALEKLRYKWARMRCRQPPCRSCQGRYLGNKARCLGGQCTTVEEPSKPALLHGP